MQTVAEIQLRIETSRYFRFGTVDHLVAGMRATECVSTRNRRINTQLRLCVMILKDLRLAAELPNRIKDAFVGAAFAKAGGGMAFFRQSVQQRSRVSLTLVL